MPIHFPAGARAAVIAASLLATSLASGPQAAAAAKCAAYSDVTKFLTGKYQENRRALGVVNDKAIVEVFTSPQGTWTMLITDRSGLSCILAAGESWEETPVLALGPAV
jgi:hypothetical protein